MVLFCNLRFLINSGMLIFIRPDDHLFKGFCYHVTGSLLVTHN